MILTESDCHRFHFPYIVVILKWSHLRFVRMFVPVKHLKGLIFGLGCVYGDSKKLFDYNILRLTISLLERSLNADFFVFVAS